MRSQKDLMRAIREHVASLLADRPPSPDLANLVGELLVNPECLDAYEQILSREFDLQWPETLLGDRALLALLETGPTGLTELAPSRVTALVLNPLKLRQLSEAIVEQSPPAWHPLLAQAGEVILRRAGVTFDDCRHLVTPHKVNPHPQAPSTLNGGSRTDMSTKRSPSPQPTAAATRPSKEAAQAAGKVKGPMTKIYRMALFGGKGTGKTCILGALAMDHKGDLSGASCTYLPEPPNEWILASSRQSGEPVEKIREAFKRGHEVYKRVMDALDVPLDQRHAPEATPIRAGDDLRYAFVFASRGRTFLVELIDYSGELVSAGLDQNIGPLAIKLREILRMRDAILILAEAPPPATDKGRADELRDFQARELKRLREAFVALMNDKNTRKYDTPVAVLVNKWDRRGLPMPTMLDEENRQLTEFLNETPQPPHARLIQAVENAISEENFQKTVVSAFGPDSTTDREGREIPSRINPLESYGLDRPFVWAAQRRDALDLEFYEDWSDRQAWWKLWQLAGTTPQQAYTLPGRYQPKSKEAKKVSKGQWKSRFASFGRSVATILLLMAGLLWAEYQYDATQHRQVQVTLADSETDPTRLRDAEKWLDSYARSYPVRHLAYAALQLPRDKARDQLVEIQKQRQDSLYEGIKKAATPRQKLKLIDEFLILFPNSPYHAELVQLRQECEFTIHEEDNLIAVQKIKDELKAAVAGNVEDQVTYTDISVKLDKQPLYPDANTEKVSSACQGVRDALTKRIAEIERNIAERKDREYQTRIAEWSNEVNGLTNIAKLGSIQQAIKDYEKRNKLPAKEETRAKLQALVSKTANQLALAIDVRDRQELEGKVRKLVNNGDHAEAAQAILTREEVKPEGLRDIKNHVRRGIVATMSKLKTSAISGKNWTLRDKMVSLKADRAVGKLLEDSDNTAIQKLFDELDRHKLDHTLYEAVRTERSQVACQKYLDDAPIKAMRERVESYLSHLTRMEGELTFTLRMTKIAWPSQATTGYPSNVTVEVNFKSVISASPKTSSGSTIKDIGSGTFKCKLSDEVTISTKINVTAFFNPNLGNSAHKVKVKDLLAGVDMSLSNDSVYTTATGVAFKIDPLPQPPPLPDWRK